MLRRPGLLARRWWQVAALAVAVWLASGCAMLPADL